MKSSSTIIIALGTVILGSFLAFLVYKLMLPQDPSYCTNISTRFNLMLISIVTLIISAIVFYIFRFVHAVRGFSIGIAILAIITMIFVSWCSTNRTIEGEKDEVARTTAPVIEEVGELEVSQDKLRDVVTTNIANLAALEAFREKEKAGVPPAQVAPSIINNYTTAVDTFLTEAQVDGFADNNGYLTEEIDDEIGNEYNEALTLVGTELRLKDGGGTLIQDLGDLYSSGAGLTLTDTTFSALDPIIGNEVVTFTVGGGLERSGTGSEASPYTLGLLSSCADNQVMAWNETSQKWDCAVASEGDKDWFAIGGTLAPLAITDNIFTQGDVSIGSEANASRLYVEDAINTVTSGVYTPTTYTFDADDDADEAAWTFVSDNGANGLNPAGTTRAWSHDTDDTTSVDIGPTSGQGGNPDGYVYTEATLPSAFGDTFHMTHNATFDASAEDWEIDFYWNQRGDENLAVLEVQTNENGAGWITRGTYGAAGPDVATAGTQIWNNETIDLAGVISGNATQIRFFVTLGTTSVSGDAWHNDFGIDTITISSPTISGYGDTVAEIYNADATSDVDLLRLSSDVGAVRDTKFRVDSDGDVYSDGTSFLGGGADVAEMYENSDDAQAGDVVVYKDKQTVIKSVSQNEVGLAGIVATNPAVVLGAGIEGVPVALSGRVPVKFSTANGPVKRGDYLTSGKGGTAVKAIQAGQTLGTAMEDRQEDGTVEVFVGVGYWAPTTVAESGQLTTATSEAIVTVEQGPTFAEFVGETWSITMDMIVSAKVVFENTVAFLGGVTFMDRVTYADDDAGGSISIPEGLTEVTLDFKVPFTHNPIITLTTREVFTQAIVKDVSTDSFTIAIEEAQEEAIVINWVALAVAKDEEKEIEREQDEQVKEQQDAPEPVLPPSEEEEVTENESLDEVVLPQGSMPERADQVSEAKNSDGEDQGSPTIEQESEGQEQNEEAIKPGGDVQSTEEELVTSETEALLGQNPQEQETEDENGVLVDEQIESGVEVLQGVEETLIRDDSTKE